jgi:hypothetical protein
VKEIMNIENELKRIEKSERNLAMQKKKLLGLKKRKKANQAKLATIVKLSEFDTPKELVEALIETYDIQLNGRRALNGHTSPSRRSRTKVTPELRDLIKAKLKDQSVNRVSKELQISYPVISKIARGQYDQL